MRRKAGLTRAAAARLVHVEPRTWARWEDGQRRVPDMAVHLFALLTGQKFKESR